MVVKNDFPNVDKVLRKLKEYVQFFESKKGKEIDEQEARENLQEVDSFISAIENYLDSVCNDEAKIKKYRDRCSSSEDVRAYVETLDNRRTNNHSRIITTMIMIDRIASSYGLEKVFDYAEEFEKSFTELTPTSIEEKRQMTERQRVKRREMGNFGLYIAASVTAGLEMSDREVRDFASCEVENIDKKRASEIENAFYTVKSKTKNSDVSRNMNYMIK